MCWYTSSNRMTMPRSWGFLQKNLLIHLSIKMCDSSIYCNNGHSLTPTLIPPLHIWEKHTEKREKVVGTTIWTIPAYTCTLFTRKDILTEKIPYHIMSLFSLTSLTYYECYMHNLLCSCTYVVFVVLHFFLLLCFLQKGKRKDSILDLYCVPLTLSTLHNNKPCLSSLIVVINQESTLVKFLQQI